MRLATFSIFIICIVTGCSTVHVRYDYNTEINFQDYKTFDWLDLQQPQKTTKNTLMDNRIKSAVSNELSAKGFELKEDTPDFLITYHSNVKDKINVTNYGYNYARRGRYAWIGTDIEVQNYKEGRLIIDFIDKQNKELFWRGVGSGSMPKELTPEIITEKINKAVKEILSNYPPGKN